MKHIVRCLNEVASINMWFPGNLIVCSLLLLGLWGCQTEPEQERPSPPDLSGCTRMTIVYLPSTLEYFFPGKSSHKHLSPEELQYLKTLDVHVVDDQEFIEGFANDLAQARYEGPAEHGIGIANMMAIRCYSNGEKLADLTMLGSTIQTRDEHQFDFKTKHTDWRAMGPPIWNLQQRVFCASKIQNLRFRLMKVQDRNKDLRPEGWCDTIADEYKTLGKEYVSAFFKCPGQQEGRCSYAVNPNCKQDSPEDTVLLFEARAGWNQHGGPELFTLDNHDPKGGFVILNDGTVKFIRTEEELRRLRWE